MALELQQIIDLVNGNAMPLPKKKRLWEEASDRISFHAKGIRPKFNNPRKSGGVGTITPANYEQRYQYLIDNYILNRHPNEQEEHYQWRLSTFPLIAQEIFLNGQSQLLGSIYQTSQFTLEANDEDDQDYLDEIEFYKSVKQEIPFHIFTDPHGKVAIIEGHYDEFPSTEQAIPLIELIESRYILYYKKKDSIFFQSANDYQGKKVWYWIDTVQCVRFVEGVRKDEKIALTTYEHGFGSMPVIDNDTDFFKPFVSWADLLCRNMSDDEVIAKNASYPHITMIAPDCPECQATGQMRYRCDTCTTGDGFGELEACHRCDGKGVISVNPGEIQLQKRIDTPGNPDNGVVKQNVRFDNPDISINTFSWKRVQEIRDMGLRSMHMSFIEEAQSGIAKSYDRQQLHFLLVNVSEKLFDIDEFCLYYLLAYRNNGEPNYSIERPTQFNIKTEEDVEDEYTKLVTASADLTIRRRKQNELMQIAASGNGVSLKRWSVVKSWDVLWGMSDAEVSNAKLIGQLNAEFFLRHIFVDTLLENIVNDKGGEWLMQQSIQGVISELNTLLKPYIPVSAVTIPNDIVLN